MWSLTTDARTAWQCHGSLSCSLEVTQRQCAHCAEVLSGWTGGTRTYIRAFRQDVPKERSHCCTFTVGGRGVQCVWCEEDSCAARGPG